MDEVLHDASTLLLVVGCTALVAVLAGRIAAAIRVPAPAVFLAAGVIAGAALPAWHDAVTPERVATAGTLALVVILFHGGFEGGWRRVRPSIAPILSLGIVGTLLTSVMLAAACHFLLRIEWELAALIGIALAPTDPAAVFSVLSGKRIAGRSRPVLEGESGANDPVGIALMIGAIAFLDGTGSLGNVSLDFAVQLAVGVLAGVAGGLLLSLTARALPRDATAAFAILGLGGAFVTYAFAAELGGSGFLAAYIAGLLLGDDAQEGIARAHPVLGFGAALAEMGMFAALGLTIQLAHLNDHLLSALGAFALLTFAVRPLVVWLCLARTGKERGERLFIAWGGLKGAVPILLASFPVIAGIHDADVIYETVFVAVAASILLQGSTLELVAARSGVLEPVPVRPNGGASNGA